MTDRTLDYEERTGNGQTYDLHVRAHQPTPGPLSRIKAIFTKRNGHCRGDIGDVDLSIPSRPWWW